MTHPPQNQLLEALPEETRRQLLERASPVSIPPGETIQAAGPLTGVHFILEGAASLCHAATGMEVSVVGSEGMIGHSVVLGRKSFRFDAYAASHIRALQVGREALGRAMQVDEARSVLLGYADTLMADVADTTVSGAMVIRARLARRLLQLAERAGNRLHTTHDQLAQCLCVRRPGITTTLHELEGEHLIRSTRGVVQILDREGLSREVRLAAKRRPWSTAASGRTTSARPTAPDAGTPSYFHH